MPSFFERTLRRGGTDEEKEWYRAACRECPDGTQSRKQPFWLKKCGSGFSVNLTHHLQDAFPSRKASGKQHSDTDEEDEDEDEDEGDDEDKESKKSRFARRDSRNSAKQREEQERLRKAQEKERALKESEEKKAAPKEVNPPGKRDSGEGAGVHVDETT